MYLGTGLGRFVTLFVGRLVNLFVNKPHSDQLHCVENWLISLCREIRDRAQHLHPQPLTTFRRRDRPADDDDDDGDDEDDGYPHANNDDDNWDDRHPPADDDDDGEGGYILMQSTTIFTQIIATTLMGSIVMNIYNPGKRLFFLVLTRTLVKAFMCHIAR